MIDCLQKVSKSDFNILWLGLLFVLILCDFLLGVSRSTEFCFTVKKQALFSVHERELLYGEQSESYNSLFKTVLSRASYESRLCNVSFVCACTVLLIERKRPRLLDFARHGAFPVFNRVYFDFIKTGQFCGRIVCFFARHEQVN